MAMMLNPVIGIMNGLNSRYINNNLPKLDPGDAEENKGILYYSIKSFVYFFTWSQQFLYFSITFIVMYASLRVASMELPFMFYTAICANYL